MCVSLIEHEETSHVILLRGIQYSVLQVLLYSSKLISSSDVIHCFFLIIIIIIIIIINGVKLDKEPRYEHVPKSVETSQGINKYSTN